MYASVISVRARFKALPFFDIRIYGLTIHKTYVYPQIQFALTVLMELCYFLDQRSTVETYWFLRRLMVGMRLPLAQGNEKGRYLAKYRQNLFLASCVPSFA